MTINEIEVLRTGLQKSFDLLLVKANRIQIGNRNLFPYGWRKAAKGRTVWRIIEELITQNLEAHFKEIKLQYVKPSESEVSVYDFECKIEGNDTPIFINIKSAVLGGRNNKDDISKGEGLKEFFREDVSKKFFVGTFFLKFNDDMTIEIVKAVVFPIAWIPDVYVNPSNNGNLQSSRCKNIATAVKRTSREFNLLFVQALEEANQKRRDKISRKLNSPI